MIPGVRVMIHTYSTAYIYSYWTLSVGEIWLSQKIEGGERGGKIDKEKHRVQKIKIQRSQQKYSITSKPILDQNLIKIQKQKTKQNKTKQNK